MHITLKATLKTDKRQDGTRAVRIRITRDRVHAYYSTGIYLNGEPTKKAARRKGDWNPEGSFLGKNWVRSSDPLHARYNASIQQDMADLQHIGEKYPDFTAAEVKREFLKRFKKEEEPVRATGYLAFFREWIRRKRSQKQHGTADMYHTNLGFLLSFKGEAANEPETLTPSFGPDLVAHLLKAGYAASTINLAMTTYRTIFRKAVLEGFLPPLQNPFELPPLVAREADMERPTKEQLLSLMTLEIPRRWRMAPHGRNVLLMQYFLHGARFSEAVTLTWADVTDTEISYLPSKRAKKKKYVPRHAGIDWILGQYERKGKYVFPYITEEDDKLNGAQWTTRLRGANRSVNLSLDKISTLAKLPISLRTHMQRHTFADVVLELTGDLRKVQGMLGHSSVVTTEKYASRLRRSVIDELSAEVYESVGKL